MNLRKKKKSKAIISLCIAGMMVIPSNIALANNISYAEVNEKAEINEYILELDRFNIKNNGINHIETSKGINEALQYAKEQGFNKIIFPKGTYLIDENNPIKIDLKDMIVDLNQSILQINTNGLEKYAIVEIVDGAERVTFTNGTIRGDRDTHDYDTVPTPHEWGNGLVFKGGRDLDINNITIENVPGYGVYTESGITQNRYDGISNKNLESGSFGDNGDAVDNNIRIRTIEPYVISKVGGEFELGYTLGYQGYPNFFNKDYEAYFYDKDMNFIVKKDCIQFRKVQIPENAEYVHFTIPQASVPQNPVTACAWISNFKPPTNVIFRDNLIKGNRSAGFAFCGGQRWLIEDNIFEENYGNGPNYAMVFEDGWELMQDVLVKGNKFINNQNDLVACAGDNLIFEENEFTKMVYMWDRTTNYEFKNNIFDGSSVTYKVGKTPIKVSGNTYKNVSGLSVNWNYYGTTPILYNEKFINSSIDVKKGTEIHNSYIQADSAKPFIKEAIFENCTFDVALAEVINTTINNSTINNANWNLQTSNKFINCIINKSQLSTHGNTERIDFDNSKFNNSNIKYNTWGSEAIVKISNSNAVQETKPLISSSAGKTKELIIEGTEVINNSSNSIIDIYDTTYSTPNAAFKLNENTFKSLNNNYVVGGKDINSGTSNIIAESNLVHGGKLVDSKYIESPYINVEVNNPIEKYEIELDKFSISNNGTNPVETSKGINDALQYAKDKGYRNIVFPKGTYLIDENNPIKIDLKNTTIDLNGAVLQINTNGLEKYSIVEILSGAEHLTFTNGFIKGDRETHQYEALESTHEWANGLVVNGGNNIDISNLVIEDLPGYGVETRSAINANRFDSISNKNLELGSIDNLGKEINDKSSIRTIDPYLISKVGEEFEVGYTLGYQGYPSFINRNYKVYFYDKDMNFIEEKDAEQFRKVKVPMGAEYVHFVMPQDFVPENPVSACAWISNFKPSTNVTFSNNIIRNNRSVGLAFGGGQGWIIENNLFENNGGNDPSFALEIKGGWELGQDLIVRENSFVNNKKDLDLSAGDNILIERNMFQSQVRVDKRATNYKLLDNLGDINIIGKENSSEINPSKIKNLASFEETEESIKLIWDAPEDIIGLIGYVIYKDGKEIQTIIADERIYTESGLKENSIYGYKIASKYSNGKTSKATSINVRTTKL